MGSENAVQRIPANSISMPFTPAQEDVPALVKKIGKTTYRARIQFSTISNEAMSDEIKRILRNEEQRIQVNIDKPEIEKTGHVRGFFS